MLRDTRHVIADLELVIKLDVRDSEPIEVGESISVTSCRLWV